MSGWRSPRWPPARSRWPGSTDGSPCCGAAGASRATASAVSIAADATRDLAGGEIVLLHDADRYSVPSSWRRTLVALPAIVDDVRRSRLEFRTIT
jgi:hypothetical protein